MAAAATVAALAQQPQRISDQVESGEDRGARAGRQLRHDVGLHKAIFTDRIKPAHVIRKVLLRQVAILNYVNPFWGGGGSLAFIVRLWLDLLLLLGHRLVGPRRRPGRWCRRRLIDEIGRAVAFGLIGEIVPSARHVQQISPFCRIVRLVDQLQTTYGIPPIVFWLAHTRARPSARPTVPTRFAAVSSSK
jgi:hypothetical protein